LKDGNSTGFVIFSLSGNGGSTVSRMGWSISSISIDGLSPDSLSDYEDGAYSTIGSTILPDLKCISSQGIGVIDKDGTLSMSMF
jgi:hypothetical protein